MHRTTFNFSGAAYSIAPGSFSAFGNGQPADSTPPIRLCLKMASFGHEEVSQD
jgi:hypothetical protein